MSNELQQALDALASEIAQLDEVRDAITNPAQIRPRSITIHVDDARVLLNAAERTYEAEAKVADAVLRAEAAEHSAAFADTYARYYHEHQLARMAGRESEHPYTFDVWYILSDDVGRRTRALMREGELVVSDSEGGFGPDEISIGGDNMSELIAQWMGLQLNERGSLAPIKEGQIKLGLVRLIMERL